MTDEQIAVLVEKNRRTYTDDLIDALEAENERLREAQWAVRHADTANDMVLMGMARDSAIAERDAQAAEIARLRAGIAGVKARGIAMQADAYTDGEKDIGWGWECAGEWLESLAQEAQETQP